MRRNVVTATIADGGTVLTVCLPVFLCDCYHDDNSKNYGWVFMALCIGEKLIKLLH